MQSTHRRSCCPLRRRRRLSHLLQSRVHALASRHRRAAPASHHVMEAAVVTWWIRVRELVREQRRRRAGLVSHHVMEAVLVTWWIRVCELVREHPTCCTQTRSADEENWNRYTSLWHYAIGTSSTHMHAQRSPRKACRHSPSAACENCRDRSPTRSHHHRHHHHHWRPRKWAGVCVPAIPPSHRQDDTHKHSEGQTCPADRQRPTCELTCQRRCWRSQMH
jgi:hypothetical protein